MNKNSINLDQQKPTRDRLDGRKSLSEISALVDTLVQGPRSEERRRVAHLLTQHIPDRASLLMHSGTITEELARALLNHNGLRVITNNLRVATIMSMNSSFEVIVAGGLVRSQDHSITGEEVTDFIGRFKADFGIIDIPAIDHDGALLESDYHDARLARAIIANSRRTLLAADYSKFGCNALVRLGDLSQIDALFTDRPLPKPISGLLADTKTVVYVAESSD